MPTAPLEPISPVQQGERDSSARSQSGSDHGSTRRPALDGIRALAVSAVAVYHFGGGATAWLPGGFLGVDVFFVLSGYLITGLLLAEYSRRGRIDLLRFWVRRLRRLAPALLLMLFAVCAWIWWASPPDDYPKRRSDIFWTVGYLANWHQIKISDTYFAAYGTASPLRHAWSLAIEEQFYLFWPTLLLVLMWAGRRRLGLRTVPLPVLGRVDGGRLLVGVGGLVGAGLSLAWMIDHFDALYPSKTYYSTQGRVQELFVGVVLAVVIPRVRTITSRVLTTVTGVGLTVLLAAILFLPDNSTAYYYGGALGICLATAALVAGLESRPDGRVAQVFSWGPAVALGRISYGVYLWHWPLVVMLPVEGRSGAELVIRQGLRVLLTLGIATASYHLVEQPILRNRTVLRSPLRVIVAALAASALVIAVAVPSTALPGTIADQMHNSSDQQCPTERVDHLVLCSWPLKANLADRPVGIALMGDSTGRALRPGLDQWAARTGSSWVQSAWKQCTASGVMVLPNSNGADVAATTCHDQAPKLIDKALDTYRPPVVLVAEYWPNNRPLLVDGLTLSPGTAEHDAALRTGYLDLVDRVAAHGGRVVFLELPPPGNQLGREVAVGRPAGHSRPPVLGNGRYVDQYNAVLRSVAAIRPASARTVSVTDLVCPGGACTALKDGTLIRYDGVHYTPGFSRYLTPILLQRMDVEPR